MAFSISTSESTATSWTSRYHSIYSDSGITSENAVNSVVPRKLCFEFTSDNETDDSLEVSFEMTDIDPFIMGHIVDHTDMHDEIKSRLDELSVEELRRQEFDPIDVLVRMSGISDDKQNIKDMVVRALEKYSEDHTLTRLSKTVLHKEVIGLIEAKAAGYLRRKGFQNTSIFQHQDKGQIIAVGPNEEVDILAEELLNGIVTQTRDTREKKLIGDQPQLLEIKQFDRKMMTKYPQSLIEIQTDKVRLEGLQEDVNSILLEIEKDLMNYGLCKIELNGLQEKLLKHGSVKNSIIKTLVERHKLKKVWSRVDNSVFVIVIEQRKIESVKTALQYELHVRQEMIHIPEIAIGLEELLKKIKQIKLPIKSRFEVELNKSQREIKIVCLEKDFESIQGKVQQLIAKQTLREEKYELSEIQLKILDLHFSQAAVSSAKVTVLPNNAGVTIRGTSNDIRMCWDNIKTTTECKKRIRIGIQAVKTVLDFLISADGKAKITEVTEKHGVFALGPNRRCTLKIEIGNIENYKADVLVNSISPNMDLDVGEGKIASSFLRKGGNELQSLLHLKQPDGVKYDEMVVTDSSKDIPCKNIFHCCLRHFVSDSTSLPRLKHMLEKCLEESEKLEHESIAMPALCAGVNEFPANLVVNTIFDVVEDFFHKNPFAKLQRVTVVVHPSKQQLKERFDDEMAKRKRSMNMIGRYFTTTGLYLSDMDIDVVSNSDDVTDLLTSLGSAISDVVT